jgi:hypothetical protein
MLLAERRQALICFCLAAMEVAWALPFWLLMNRRAPPLWTSYGILLIALLAWILVLELLGRTEVKSPLFEIVTLAIMAVTSLLFVWAMLHAPWSAGPVGLADIFLQGGGGLAPGVVLIITNLFLWQRATAASSRDLSFFNVGFNFRIGFLILLLGAGLYYYVRAVSPVPLLLWLYLTLGLIAIAVARINEKSRDAQSTGTPLPLRRFLQLVLAVGLTVGATVLLSLAYTPDGVRAALSLLLPLWLLIRPLITALLILAAKLLDPLFRWLEALLQALLSKVLGGQVVKPVVPAGAGQPAVTATQQVPPWIAAGLKQGLLVLGIAIVVLLVIGFLLLYLEKSRRGGAQADGEEEEAEPLTLGSGIFANAVKSLRGAAGLVRRFGVGRHLLAAVSVQNIYANLCRLARQRGYTRRPAQPPDDYLPVLAQAFPGQEEPLRRITAAYMRVHYGDHPVGPDEIAVLRQDYRTVRQTVP